MFTAIALLPLLSPAHASSHREAPAIAKDPTADITDFYMFRDPNDWTRLVLIMNVNPMELPGGGPNFHYFDDDVRYNINIDNTGDGVAHIVLRTTFHTEYNYPDTFLYNVGDIASAANLNMVQTYTIEKIENGRTTTIATGTVAPANVGEKSDPTMSVFGSCCPRIPWIASSPRIKRLERAVHLEALEVSRPSLEDIYLEITGGEEVSA